jgi:hypothetical protein
MAAIFGANGDLLAPSRPASGMLRMRGANDRNLETHRVFAPRLNPDGAETVRTAASGAWMEAFPAFNGASRTLMPLPSTSLPAIGDTMLNMRLWQGGRSGDVVRLFRLKKEVEKVLDCIAVDSIGLKRSRYSLALQTTLSKARVGLRSPRRNCHKQPRFCSRSLGASTPQQPETVLSDPPREARSLLST